MSDAPLTSNERLALIRKTLADLEKNGHNCDWGREADLKWCAAEIDRLSQDNARYINAHDVLMIEREALQKRVAELERNRDMLEADLKRFVAHAARGVHEPAAQASKDHVIRTLRIAGASCDGPNAFDAAADMLLGQSDEPAGPASKQEAAGTVLLGSMDKRTYLYVCQTAERMEIERANARAAGVQDLHDFVFELDGQRFELPYRELCKRLRQEDKNVLLALVREGIKCGTSTRAFLSWVKRAEFIIANERAPDEPPVVPVTESALSISDCPACNVGNPGVYVKDGMIACPHRPATETSGNQS